jgi:hypothetical protein
MKRDYISEIVAKKSRLRKRGGRWDQVTNRIDNLIELSEFLKASKLKELPFRNETAKYLPIGFVACIEGYFRLVYRDLIDHGDPYRSNATSFKDIRVGIDHVIAMQSGKLTCGEFIAHLLPANNIEDIESCMSILLGEPFLEKVKKYEFTIDDKKPKTSITKSGLDQRLFLDLKEIFDLRHICAHELAPKIKIKIPYLIRSTGSAFMLMYITDSILDELLVTG